MMAFFALIAIIALCGALLGYFAIRFAVEGDPMADKLNNLLPQTQCGQCGYPGCKPYAEAMANGEAEINQCIPGGNECVEKLADTLGVEFKPIDASAENKKDSKQQAFIIEDWCIGCTKCLQACPVDAILGSARHVHTVIKNECTGCELCVPSCPVDCIVMRDEPAIPQNWIWPNPAEHSVDDKDDIGSGIRHG